MIFANTEIFWWYLAGIIFFMTLIFCYFFYKINKKLLQIIILCLAVICLIISIFSPKIGNYDKNIQTLWWNVLFISDLSSSMEVEDIDGKYWKIARLDFIKKIMNYYVDTNQNNKYWLYAFAGEPLEILPFTTDLWLFKTILNGIDEKNISVKWSDFTKLFWWLENYISRVDEPTTFVILSDAGEIENLKISKNLQKLFTQKSIKILFVTVWTQKWWLILDGVDFYGRPTFKTYNWDIVISKVEKNKVEKIVKTYDFWNIFSDSHDDYEKISQHINENILRSQMEINISQARDISHLFIALFLVFFTTFLFLEKRKI